MPDRIWPGSMNEEWIALFCHANVVYLGLLCSVDTGRAEQEKRESDVGADVPVQFSRVRGTDVELVWCWGFQSWNINPALRSAKSTLLYGCLADLKLVALSLFGVGFWGRGSMWLFSGFVVARGTPLSLCSPSPSSYCYPMTYHKILWCESQIQWYAII
jgi:hypothetical protein